MRYADTLLIEGEEVALRTRQHWLAFLINSRWGIITWIVAILLLGFSVMLNLTGTVSQIIGWAVLILFFIGLVIVLIELWQWYAQDYMITNRRLMKVWGVFNKRSVDSSLEKINDAQLDQSVWGRLLNYGHLDILTASTESELDDYDMIRDPKGFKKVMLTQKQALDSGAGYAPPPSPPLRAEGAPPMVQPTTPAPAAPAPAAPAQAAPAAPGAAAESLEVTQTLARLADLRDRGAISEEEYQAKKQELLDRL
ncbi:MAG TPA: PH domain-containing protein [Candidatus Limnocylindrales bacterium]|jgi:hypothetical protein